MPYILLNVLNVRHRSAEFEKPARCAASVRFGNIGLMVNQHMYPRVAIAGTEQLVRLARPNDGPAAFDGGAICLQPKQPFAVHYDLHGIVHVHGVGGATAHIQKMTGPEITTVFGNLIFHR